MFYCKILYIISGNISKSLVFSILFCLLWFSKFNSLSFTFLKHFLERLFADCCHRTKLKTAYPREHFYSFFVDSKNHLFGLFYFRHLHRVFVNLCFSQYFYYCICHIHALMQGFFVCMGDI